MIENYIAHLNGFRMRRRVHPLGSTQLALYLVLLETCNELGWMDWFCAPVSVLRCGAGLSESAFYRARNALVRLGYVEFRAGRGQQAGRYRLPDLSRCRPGAPNGEGAAPNAQQPPAPQEGKAAGKAAGKPQATPARRSAAADGAARPGANSGFAHYSPACTAAGASTKGRGFAACGPPTEADAAAKPAGKPAPLTKPIPKEKDSYALAGTQQGALWAQYEEMRRSINKPLTPRARQLAAEQLQALAPHSEEEQRMILDQSIFNCWQGFYPLRRRGPAPAPPTKAGGNPFAGLVL